MTPAKVMEVIRALSEKQTTWNHSC